MILLDAPKRSNTDKEFQSRAGEADYNQYQWDLHWIHDRFASDQVLVGILLLRPLL